MEPLLPEIRGAGGGLREAAALPAGFRLHRLGAVASTNDEARRLAQQAAPDRTVVLAETQTAGRGRYSRQWESPRGNLYASFVFRPAVAPRYAGQIGYVAALAVHDTVAALIGRPSAVACKWPNDVLAGGEKIAGILPESSIGSDGALEWIVLGIGLNIVSAPADALRPATSLSAQGGSRLDAETVLARLSRSLDGWMVRWIGDGFDCIRRAWLDRAGPVGSEIRVVLSERSVAGRFGGLDRDGALILETAAGREIVHSGEVFSAGGR